MSTFVKFYSDGVALPANFKSFEGVLVDFEIDPVSKQVVATLEITTDGMDQMPDVERALVDALGPGELEIDGRRFPVDVPADGVYHDGIDVVLKLTEPERTHVRALMDQDFHAPILKRLLPFVGDHIVAHHEGLRLDSDDWAALGRFLLEAARFAYDGRVHYRERSTQKWLSVLDGIGGSVATPPTR